MKTVNKKKKRQPTPAVAATWHPMERWPGDAIEPEFTIILDALKRQRVSLRSVREEMERQTLYVADRYVNHGDRSLYLSFKNALRYRNSTTSKMLMRKLITEIEALSVAAFFKEVKPLVRGNARLEDLYERANESMQVRWSLQQTADRLRDQNKKNANSRRAPFSKEELLNAIESHNFGVKQELVAYHLRVTPKTLRKWSKIYGVKTSRR